MSNRIITISRQFGSGGRTIGRNVAEQLGIPCYDQELVNEIVKESGFAQEYIKESGEYAFQGGWLANALAPRDQSGRNIQDELYFAQNRVIQNVAHKGPCVIIGRCADYVLKDDPECSLLRAFIYADMDKRAERIVNQYGERSDAPRKRLIDKDKRRAAYYQIYTDVKWGDCKNYDICLNSGVLGIDSCVRILADLY